jgi:hypothetical protein
MCPRLCNAMSPRTMAAALALLVAIATAGSAQASCGDYLQGGPPGGLGVADPWQGTQVPVPRHGDSCRDGSCRTDFPAPASDTGSRDLLKHTAVATVLARPEESSQRNRAAAGSAVVPGPDQTRLFRPPRGA